MPSEVAVALVHPPVEAGLNLSASMAALIQSTSESVAVSNPLSAPSVIASPDSISFLKQSKPDNLSSIASAGLHVSPPGDQPQMASSAADRPAEQDREAERNSSQVAREALGASEKSPAPPAHASPEHMQVDSRTNTESSDPYGSTDHHQDSLMHTSTMASPGPIEESASQDGDRPRNPSEIDQDSNKSFSYPMPTAGINDPRRGLSLPNTGYNRGSPRSPGAKRHRCPYCSTEFTRQHNLKSHLLTHSQEKPFVCQTCQSRFRRLHDLKRHTKLHTGERPHICPKCGRRFARGDALARHNKGQGGCAGRRASMGSFGPDDEYGDGGPDDAMDGLVYAEPERMDEEDERRLNMPSIREHDAQPLPRSDSLHTHQRSTYPPIAASRPGAGGLFPPSNNHGGSVSSTSPTSQTGNNMTFPPAGHHSGASIFPSSSTNDNPKPLSPNALSSQHEIGAQSHRAHSPSMAGSLPHPQPSFGRSGQPNHVPSGLGLPPPQPGAPQLPPPPGMSSPDSRFGPQAATKRVSTHSHSSSHGLVAPEGDANQVDKLWSYVRSMNDEMKALRAEVASLRAQLASTTNTSATAPADVNAVNTSSR
ncbi:hypothetical protein N7474_002932 [Penicillium riverlandense]|uniref:uncharacterized protein n=1 Tax=Penicillium riverlandense TaxID=1903569 RepID=UPI0025495BAD|nr:uncharacterized protein N7474_002932 [Penicillium riverlandense]KAJ5825794.1 hypothetical protein N7474_002932 [Penicillium riverlandense]